MKPTRCEIKLHCDNEGKRSDATGWFYGIIIYRDYERGSGEEYPLAVVHVDGEIFLREVTTSSVKLLNGGE